jgi:uncharacterized protein (TIGR02118 family)
VCLAIKQYLYSCQRQPLNSKFSNHLNFRNIQSINHNRQQITPPHILRLPDIKIATMTVSCTVLYPNESDATFNMDYYLSTHMPLVGKHFGKHGLKSWSVTEFQPGPDGAKPLYSVQAILVFGAAEEVGKAIEAEGTVVFGDVPNFSNKHPVFLMGPVKGESK